MKDLISLIEYYINEEMPPKETNCSYERAFTLSEIANTINIIANKNVPVIIKSTQTGDPYAGTHNLPIKTYGLENGIKDTLSNLKG